MKKVLCLLLLVSCHHYEAAKREYTVAEKSFLDSTYYHQDSCKINGCDIIRDTLFLVCGDFCHGDNVRQFPTVKLPINSDGALLYGIPRDLNTILDYAAAKGIRWFCLQDSAGFQNYRYVRKGERFRIVDLMHPKSMVWYLPDSLATAGWVVVRALGSWDKGDFYSHGQSSLEFGRVALQHRRMRKGN